MHHNMTFFDKLFTIKNRNNKNENGLKIGIEPLSFSSSHLELPKEQIRVVIFRECDRRGRKLLFDSQTVEKLSLGSSCQSAAGYLCRQKCDQGVKISDFVEVTSTHGYRYKKPCNDVTALGEMIFGSVAMVYKGGNTCKIHSIPSPKRVMFTTVVHAPGHCRYRTASERSNDGSLAGSSLTSLNEDLEINQTSSSDSKLYKNKESNKINTSTYPCLKNTSALNPVTNSLEIGINLNKSLLQKISNINCRSVCSSSSSESYKNNLNYETKLTGCERLAVNSSHDKFDAGSNGHLNSSRKNSDCKYFDPGDSFGCSNVIFQQLSDSKNGSSSNISSWSGSLGSLRRRWMQSHATSVDNPCCDETESAPSKTRTKLGLGLVIDLTDTLQDEIEKFLFNHTIVIDSIINKLQSSIEMAYLRKEHFVDLTHTAFLDCQQSMFELITGGKYARPMWLTMTEETKIEPEPKPQVLENIYSHLHDSIKPNSKKQDSVNNLKLKFLNDFCEVLTRFDTKNTNFFISTLLTAVLTHHLSWVTSIADSDNLASTHKLRYAIKNLRPYNPIWAQLNDLCGLLGSPLRATKTIVTGSESNRNCMASILQIVTYFVRCYNVVESVYESDINEITKFDENCLMSQEKLYEDFENFDSGIDCTYNGVPENKCVNRFHVQKIENNEQSNIADKKVVEPEKPVEITSTIENSDNTRRIQENNFQKSAYSGGLKRSKSCLSRLKSEESLKKCNRLYPSIDDLAKMENISLSDLDFNEKNNKKNISMSNGDLSEKIQKLIRVPSKAVICHLEQNLSPDEGYDTVDSSNVREIFSQKLENQEFDSSFSSPKKSDNVLFVLGENEELVNLSKKVVMTKSSVIDIEKEDSKDNILLDSRNNNVGRSKSMNILVTCCERMSEKRCRTLENVFSDCEKDEGRTLWQNFRDDKEISQHSQIKSQEAGRKTPWIRCELPMPRVIKSTCCSQRLDISSVIGSVNDHYNSEQIVQGVLEEKKYWEHTLRKDLSLGAHNPVLESEVSETLCIIADMDAWEVTVCSSHTYVVDRNKYAGVRVGMSQIVADMLESLLQLQRMKLSPEFCLYHIERKLNEIYMKSKSVAELLDTTELCTMDYLTSRLDIGVNDVPLLLAVATTHSPHITSKYGLSFT